MQPQLTDHSRDGIVVASGYGLKLYVERGHLIVHDGIGRTRRTRRYNRATCKLKRVIVLGHDGFVTLEALRWVRDVGAAFVQIDADSQLIAQTTAYRTDLPHLRRAQALAADDRSGLELAAWVLAEKLAGQAAVAAQLAGNQGVQEAIEVAAANVAGAESIDGLVGLEAQAAAAYWDAWASLPVRFGRADSARIPNHWQSFGQRHSPLSGSPRLAANPANAILNYLYSLQEGEMTLACQAVGLDPGMGVFHRDRRARASFALDLMEAIRPVADAYVLALLTERALQRGEFVETRRGVCRLLPALAAKLAETTSVWASHAAPIAEQAARRLGASTTGGRPLPTPLTQSNRVAAWEGRRTLPGRTRVAVPQLPATCRECAAPLPNRRRRYCDSCRAERFARNGDKGRAAAAAVLARLREEGRAPTHSAQATLVRARKNASHQTAIREWSKQHDDDPPDPAVFDREIRPALRFLPIATLVAATGLSPHYCSLIRLGKRTPHPRHWPAFRTLAEESVEAQ